ncbi:cytochrome [Actinomadura rugatobispora]|uniref:Cytochrome n=1 Tax=Actinomadura rugatobispora TaxID=1994 RepID=A0ABW0ZVS0_9ACTN|nr:cytochrome P450 [Actinomadura rugatobispora]
MDAPTPDEHPPLESISAEPLLTADYQTRPAVFYESLRARYGPVVPVDVLGVPIWLVLGYAQVLDVMRDPRGVWSKRVESWRAHAEGRVPADWPMLPIYTADSSAQRDGAELTRLRNAWSVGLRPFQDRTRPQAKELERAVSRYADDLITLIGEGGLTGQADLATQYARPLPLLIINRLLGFEGRQGDELVQDLWRALDAGPEAGAATARIAAAAAEICAARALQPTDDLASHMLAAAPDLTPEEIAHELPLVLGLLGDHTGTLICTTAVKVIGGDVRMRESLSAGMLPEVVNRAVIADPPLANTTLRWPKTEVRMGRYRIAAGDPVMLSLAGAHTDPAFADGIDPDAIYSSRAHLAWGSGAHACLGRELATTVTTLAVGKLFERFSALRLAVPEEQLGWHASPLSRSLRSLPVLYELPPDAAGRRPVGPPPEQIEAEPEAGRQGPTASEPSLARRVLRAFRRS